MASKRKYVLRFGLLVLAGTVMFVIASRSFNPQPMQAAEGLLVPMEIVLLVDTSSSVDATEYEIQKQGYVEAFSDSDIIEEIDRIGGIAVIYVEWDRANNQTIRIPWTHLRTHSDCYSFSSAIYGITRQSQGTTMMAPALEFAKNQLMTNDFLGMRRVIDVSGDGQCKNWQFYTLGIPESPDQIDPAHYGTPWSEVITGLAGTVHSVNGVFIGDDDEHLVFYQDILPQGVGAFTLHAQSFSDFTDTVKEKILREVAEMPKEGNGSDIWMTFLEVPEGSWGLGGQTVSIEALSPLFTADRQSRIRKYLESAQDL